MVKERYDVDIEQAVILMAIRDDNNPEIFVEDIAPWVRMTRKFFDLHNRGLLSY
jgi:hypothetical protein